MKSVLVGILPVLFLMAGSACATSHGARPLDIRSDGTGVLGCIPADEGEAVDVADAGVSPSRLGEQTPAAAWQISLDAGSDPVRLEPGECLAYRQLPAGYANTIPPSELRDDWPYSFSIRSPERGKHGTRIHGSMFCIERTGEGIKLVQVPETPATVTAATCRQLLGSSDAP